MVDWDFWITLIFAVAKWGSITLFTLVWGWVLFWLGREAVRSYRQHKRAERSIKEWNDWKEGKGKFG